VAEVVASEAEVVAEIQRIVREELGIKGPVERGSQLVSDLALDSMTLTTLAVALEDRFRVILTDVGPEEIATVESLAACILRKMAEGDAA
jgi:acyl carrier protein